MGAALNGYGSIERGPAFSRNDGSVPASAGAYGAGRSPLTPTRASRPRSGRARWAGPTLAPDPPDLLGPGRRHVARDERYSSETAKQ